MSGRRAYLHYVPVNMNEIEYLCVPPVNEFPHAIRVRAEIRVTSITLFFKLHNGNFPLEMGITHICSDSRRAIDAVVRQRNMLRQGRMK